ncbi:T9SS type A sorting domain-containing protein [Arenibacter palladensis]|uniref:T9SS type A sorting domain-containing protein n=1 Tax=Arenibacter palladensis TaxID=237373 RepID=UPI002FD44283
MAHVKHLLFFCISLLYTNSSFSQWTQTSGPIGGSTEEIFKVQNSLVLATHWGGVYKSIDNGESWNPSNSGFPNNPRIYDMFEEDGILYTSIENKGIYVSENQGDSWTSISPLQKDETSYHIFIEGDNIYGGLAYGGLIYSPDKGDTWQFKTEGTTGHQFVNLHVYNSKLYAKRNNKLYETQDHGDTWVEIIVPGLSPNGVSSMTTHNDMLFIADQSNVFFSQDALTWTNANIPSPGASITSMQSHEGTLYATTNKGRYFYLSEIGQSWTLVQKPNTEGFVSNLLFLDEGIIMSASDGINKSVDDGLTWSVKNNGIKAQSAYSMAKNDNYVFASGSDGIYRSNDNGQNWSIVNNEFLRPRYPQNTPDIVNVDNTLFVSTFGGVFSSSDNGDSWVPKYLSNSYSKYTGHLAYDNGVLVTSESGTGVLLSTDMGETWILAQTAGLNPNFQYISMLIKGDTIVLGTYQGEIFLSTDLGQSWSDIAIPGQYSNQRPIDLEYHNDKLYVTTTQGLWVSEDLGGHWLPFIANDTQYMWDVEILGDAVYVATFNGVQVSTEGRSSWYPLTEGMGPKRIIKLLVHDDVMFAAIEANGIWSGPLSELGVPPLDDDKDGIANVDDVCPNTIPGVPVNNSGCDLIDLNAISVYGATPTCPNVDNGIIEIATTLIGYSFDIHIVGEGRDQSFTAINLNGNLKVDDLAPGTYEVTVSIPAVLHEQTFGVKVNELSSIAGKFQGADYKSRSARYIVSGSNEYMVNVNGIQKKYVFDSTIDNEIVLHNLKMTNKVLISGNNDCQGKIDDTFSLEAQILVYPTITSGLLSMSDASTVTEIRVYNSVGQLVLSEKTETAGVNNIHLDNCTPGLYIVHVLSKGDLETFKIIKL